MKKLFKITLNPRHAWDTHPPPLYVMQPTKGEAIRFVEHHLRAGYTIKRVSCLGYELSAVLYKGGNP